MTDHKRSSLSRSVAERKSSYPLRLHHKEAGKSTSPIKKTREYGSNHPSKGRRRFGRPSILTDGSPSASSHAIAEGTAYATRRENREDEVSLLHGGNSASGFQPMDVDFESRGWENEGGISVTNEGARDLSLDESDEMFAEAVEADVVGFIPICGNSKFVVEGWSRVLARGTVRTSFCRLVTNERKYTGCVVSLRGGEKRRRGSVGLSLWEWGCSMRSQTILYRMRDINVWGIEDR